MFEAFWKYYPRKEAKKAAFKAWNKLTTEQQEKSIQNLPLHVKHWANREREYIPLPASWLNGWRFDDELQSETEKVVKWWESDQLTLAYGNQKGMRPRPGETMQEYRARLRAA